MKAKFSNERFGFNRFLFLRQAKSIMHPRRSVKFLGCSCSFGIGEVGRTRQIPSSQINILSINGISKSGHKVFNYMKDVDEFFIFIKVHAHTLGGITLVDNVTPYIISAFYLAQHIGQKGIVEEKFASSPTGIAAGRDAVYIHLVGRGNKDELVIGCQKVIAIHASDRHIQATGLEGNGEAVGVGIAHDIERGAQYTHGGMVGADDKGMVGVVPHMEEGFAREIYLTLAAVEGRGIDNDTTGIEPYAGAVGQRQLSVFAVSGRLLQHFGGGQSGHGLLGMAK